MNDDKNKQPNPPKEYVRVEKRVLANAIQIIGELPTGPIPFKTVSMVVSELQAAHEGAALKVVGGLTGADAAG